MPSVKLVPMAGRSRYQYWKYQVEPGVMTSDGLAVLSTAREITSPPPLMIGFKRMNVPFNWQLVTVPGAGLP